MKRTFLVSACLVMVVFVMASCQKPLTAQQIWDRTFDIMQTVSSFKTSATLQATNSAFPEESLSVQLFGSLDGSGKSQLEFTMSGEVGGTVYIYMVGPDEFYVGASSDSGIAWEGPMTAAEFGQVGSFIFIQVLTPFDDLVRTGMIDPIMSADEVINGIPCYHISLQIDPAIYKQFLFKDVELSEFDMSGMEISGAAEYWIGKADFRTYRSFSTVQFSPAGDDPATATQAIIITSTIDYSAFNEPVTFPTP